MDANSGRGNMNVKEIVKEYYGEQLKKTSDLKTGACCAPGTLPGHIEEALSLIEGEIKTKYYGCGSPIPLSIEGLKVLDVGCGTGRDCYVMSQLVGERGFVYGIDMTENQIGVARKYVDGQTAKFGYERPNVGFILDYIENIGTHFSEESLDLATSNCVLNLVEEKEIVLKQVYEALTFGGEFYFSDVYADRRTSEEIRTNPVLYGECLGGALYYKDLQRMARRAGFFDPRIVSKRGITIEDEGIRALTGNVNFYSITYRLWKLEGLEDDCEDYGHVATYEGGIPQSPHAFPLDCHHIFERNKPYRVCGNTALMLSETRFNKYFTILGTFNEHFGQFKACGTTTPEGRDDLVPSDTESCC
jgi:SAM-dependent methyltransferase